MKFKHYSKLFLLAAFSALSSCSPRIITEITNPRSTPIEVQDIIVTDDISSLDVQLLGHVAIVDRGTTSPSNCKYDKIEALAKEEASKAGGNIILIDNHLVPSVFYSSCHQIWASVMYSEKLEANPQTVALTHYDPIVATSKNHIKPYLTLYANAGFGFIGSKIYTPDGSTLKPGAGLDLNAGVEWIFKRGWGVGLRGSYYKKDFDILAADAKWELMSISPQAIYKGNLSDKWLMKISLGVGLGVFTESISNISVTETGVDVNLGLGVEYKITDRFGLGLSIESDYIFLDQSGYEGEEANAVSRSSVLGGLRWYF